MGRWYLDIPVLPLAEPFNCMKPPWMGTTASFSLVQFAQSHVARPQNLTSLSQHICSKYAATGIILEHSAFRSGGNFNPPHFRNDWPMCLITGIVVSMSNFTSGGLKNKTMVQIGLGTREITKLLLFKLKQCPFDR